MPTAANDHQRFRNNWPINYAYIKLKTCVKIWCPVPYRRNKQNEKIQ